MKKTTQKNVPPFISNFNFQALLLIAMFFGTCFILPNDSPAQEFCRTSPDSKYLLKKWADPEKAANGPYHIRVYMHVLRRSDGTGGQSPEDVVEALAILNGDFNQHDIFFEWDGCIYPVDETEIYEAEEDEDLLLNVMWTRDPHTDGIDIYLAQDDHEVQAGRTSVDDLAIWVSGSYWRPPYGSLVKSHILSHEMGHMFSLLHTHYSCQIPDNWEEPDGSNSADFGDYIEDTPADPNIRDHVDENCVWEQVFCIDTSDPDDEGCKGCRVDNFPPYEPSAYSPDVKNIMSYAPPGCMEYFSDDQVDEMLAAIASAPHLQPTIVQGAVWDCECDMPDMHIYTDKEFVDDVGFNGNVFVHAPATLTISSTVQFGKSKHIIVERGAKLHVNGGTLTKCPDAEDWGGIRVEGNSVAGQPSAAGPPVAGLAGIVLINNGAHLEWARTGISTSKFGAVGSSAYWGGLIHCDGATFSHNGRLAEILKYDLPNQSKFVDCTFESGNIGYAGVTIWDTDGVTFNRCKFYDMSSQGISATDAGVNVVDNNQFVGNNRGIVSRASTSFTASMIIGKHSTFNNPVASNKFIDNTVHIESEATNQLDGLRIVNNEFFESSAAIRLNGPSKFFIYDNTIDQTTVGIHAFGTGSLGSTEYNYINGNDIAGIFGINVSGENRELSFLCNDFNTTIFDFRLKDRNGANGEIRSMQGSGNGAAGNCFTDPGQQYDVLTSGTTNTFDYYAVGAPACKIPLTLGNYNVLQAGEDGCVFEEFNDDPTIEDYNDIKNQIDVFIANGGQPADVLSALLEEKEHILLSLVGDYLEADDLAGALGLLETEGTHMAELMSYGLQVDAGLYQDARLTLTGISNSVPEMTTFKQIQDINLDRLEQGFDYLLSASDSLFLENIATSEMGVKSYARAVLYLLTGREIFDVFTMEDGGVGQENENVLSTQSEIQYHRTSFAIYPNPSKNEFSIRIFEGAASSTLRITSMLGRVLFEQKLSESDRPLAIGHDLHEGIYMVTLFDRDNKVIDAKKVFIQR